MATMDVFGSDAFSMMELTNAVNRQEYLPNFLGSLNLFSPRPVRTTTIAIEEVANTLSLIPTSLRGEAPTRRTPDRRKVHNENTVRISTGDRITADEIQSIRAFGSESELKQVAGEVNRRMMDLRNNIELTHENMRLGAAQGIVYDSDGSTEIVNWYTVFSMTQPTEIDFDLDNATPASGAVRLKCAEVVRNVTRNLKAPMAPGSFIIGLAGDTFFDQLIAHEEVRATYLNAAGQSALSLQTGYSFDRVMYGGIEFVNYRGTDDGSTLAISATECKFFPVGVPGLFQTAYSPAETFDYVNTPGQPVYAMQIPDRDRNAWVDIELYSYPLHICTRPLALQRARNT